MAQRKARPFKKPVYSKAKEPVRPLWMKVIWWVAMIVASVLAMGAFAATIIKYYRVVSK